MNARCCNQIIRAWWPWIFLIIFVFPICWTIAVLQRIEVDEEYPTGPFGGKWCNGDFFVNNLFQSVGDDDSTDEFCDRQHFALLSLFGNFWYLGYLLWMTIVVAGVWMNRKCATYIITLENTTYFFNSVSCFFWVFLPIYMCTTGTIPFRYDAATLTFGGLWLEVWTWSLLVIIKKWAPPGQWGLFEPMFSDANVIFMSCALFLSRS